jgi:hypothetical protein
LDIFVSIKATLLDGSYPTLLTSDSNGSVTVQLPAGPSDDSFRLLIAVQVFDDFNDFATYTLPTPVTVSFYKAQVSGLLDDVINQNSSSAVNMALSSGDTSAVSNTISTFCTTLSVLVSVSSVWQ